ncbi:hypothetical protein [Pedobacter insulae]|uniref:Uncharacterized protein n=1 Tax=Pedobacter insulae TaxID=414048 RepID=A0A1I2Z803_9SPHI|nr:hypothetical protein [Pedobacter insulae]SFH33679.1 hypothetical protein SAMN04489864_10942 [Pedobacter insulae]
MKNTTKSTSDPSKGSENELTKKAWFWIAVITLLILAFSPALVYMSKFKSGGLSSKNIDWSQFGIYLSGTLSPVIALTGAILTFTLGFVSNRHNQTLLKKQEREKRPLINVSFMDKDTSITIALHNKGLGPMIITKYLIENEKTNQEKSGVFDWIESLPCQYGNYTGNQDNLVLREGEKRNLLRLEGELSDVSFINHRDRLRNLLGDLRIKIAYNDIYDTAMPVYTKSFSWFKRHINNPQAPKKN